METVSSSCVVSVAGLLLVWLESLALRQLLTSGQEVMLFSIHSELPQNSFAPPKKAFLLPASWHILLTPIRCQYLTHKLENTHVLHNCICKTEATVNIDQSKQAHTAHSLYSLDSLFCQCAVLLLWIK